MNENSPKSSGGNIQCALNGESVVDLKAAIEEAWLLTKNTKAAILQGVFFTISFTLLLIVLWQGWFNIDDWEQAPVSLRVGLNLLITVMSAPLLTALMLMGMAHSIGRTAHFMPLVKRLAGSVLLVLAAIMITALVNVGMTLLLLPGVYLAMATGFSLPLLVEKKLSPSKSIILSLKVFNIYWRQLVLFYLIFTLLFVLGAFTFGVAYIWIVPFYLNCKGVLYRELFGIEVESDSIDSTQNKDESVFHA
ncbi:MAG: putative membrane protein [Paraglaciecola sp.]